MSDEVSDKNLRGYELLICVQDWADFIRGYIVCLLKYRYEPSFDEWDG